MAAAPPSSPTALSLNQQYVGLSPAVGPRTLLVGTATVSVGATTAQGASVAVQVPIGRGQIIHPLAISGTIQAQNAAGTAAGTLFQVGIVFQNSGPGFQVIQWVIGLTSSTNLFGLVNAVFQPISLPDISALDLATQGVQVISPTMQIAGTAMINNSTAGAINYNLSLYVLYQTIYVQQ